MRSRLAGVPTKTYMSDEGPKLTCPGNHTVVLTDVFLLKSGKRKQQGKKQLLL